MMLARSKTVLPRRKAEKLVKSGQTRKLNIEWGAPCSSSSRRQKATATATTATSHPPDRRGNGCTSGSFCVSPHLSMH